MYWWEQSPVFLNCCRRIADAYADWLTVEHNMHFIEKRIRRVELLRELIGIQQ